MPAPGIYHGFGDPLILGVKTYPEMVDIYRSVSDSIRDILTTQVGTRRMRPTYGCNIYSYIFENNTELLRARAEREVRRSLELNEPRILVQAVTVTMDTDSAGRESVIVITVGYSIRGQYLETEIRQRREGG